MLQVAYTAEQFQEDKSCKEKADYSLITLL